MNKTIRRFSSCTMLRNMCAMLALGLVGLGALAQVDAKTLRLSSLEWPPYAGPALQGQGASVLVAKEAFKAMGYALEVEFFPWSKAVSKAKTDEQYHGYFPEYWSDEVNANFHCVGSIGEGPLAFAQRKDKPIVWKSLDDLAKLPIGVVKDYVNTDEFDKRVAQKRLVVDVSLTDTSNLLKLELNRIDLAVVDSNVFEYLRQSVPQLKRSQGSLELNPKILEVKKLYICFKKNPQGVRLGKVLSEGLRKIDVDALMQKNLKR